MGRAKAPASMKKGGSESKAKLKERNNLEKQLLANTNTYKNVPEHLDENAKRYYEFLVSELELTGLLCDLDGAYLEQISDVYSKILHCCELIDREGLFIAGMDRYGTPTLKEHPAVKVRDIYLKQFKWMGGELGLSPSARAAIAGNALARKEEESDPLLKLLKGGM